MNAEPTLGIHPESFGVEPGGNRQLLEFSHCVFVGKLRSQGFTLSKVKLLFLQMNDLGLLTDQNHLDPPQWVVKSLVVKLIRFKICP